ncbi:MAG: hypothetical protein HOA85_02100 [Candidatus Pacebacteria bacterium]|nr:hypothetical protein [Candidatus Paceibacterota bacterium]MBT6756044.1 hypothetical protein [Candidatus Paceibacterota bacterium]
MKNTPYKKLFFVTVIWRFILLLVGYLADSFIVYAPSFPHYTIMLASMNLPRWLYSWGNFDGVHYLTIVSEGYFGTGLIQAFFPVFPGLITIFKKFFQITGLSSVIPGLFLVMFFIFQLIVAYGVVLLLFTFVKDLLRKTNKQAWWTVIAFLSFPTSLFFGALYNEGLFLLLVLGSFWAAHHKKWWLAGVLGMIISATRVVGLAIWPALLLELWLSVNKIKKLTDLQKNIKIKKLLEFIKKESRNITVVSLTLLGLGSYMFYLWRVFGDPLYFFHLQSEFGAGRQEGIILLPQVIWRYIKIFMTVPHDWKFFSFIQEFIFSLVTLGSLLIFWKKIRPSHLLFSLLVFILPTLTGTLSSMPRYILVCFPIYFLLGEFLEKNKIIRGFALALSWLLLIINTLLFIQGYWVA